MIFTRLDVAQLDSYHSTIHTMVFHDVHDSERVRINARRGKYSRSTFKAPFPKEGPVDVTGLALSGGGIRSAAFCLGALQALDDQIGIEKIDYLSTVSGGGYIGASLSVGLNEMGQKELSGKDNLFPFRTGERDKSDNPAVGHIRNYSRYLIPGGIKDVISSVTVICRGLAANILMVTAAILIAAGVTLYAIAARSWLNWQLGSGWNTIQHVLGGFAYTKAAFIIGVVIQICWALQRSIRGGPEFKGIGFRVSRALLVLVGVLAFCELQFFALDNLKTTVTRSILDARFAEFTRFMSQITPLLAPLAAIVAFASKNFGDTIKSQEGQKGFTPLLKWFLSKLVLAAAALALPIIIWVTYLNFAVFGIAKSWAYPMASLYCSSGVLLFIFCLLLSPNANSLHRLYRDRLGKAFLFDPSKIAALKMNDSHAEDPEERSNVKLSTLKKEFTPVHLLNAALNIQGSDFANRRGRNADFFFFSQDYCGSNATGFIKTRALERINHDIDMATVMAISGAAAASNMGSNTVFGFAPTLALLNIRLGYWMRNPRTPVKRGKGALRQSWNVFAKLYLVKEMLSQLNETDDQVYLTDGGHIENLGLYELLRRRCRKIIVVDAEADPGMTFRSFINVQRYARIDLGVRIDLPWQQIRLSHEAANAFYGNAKKPGQSLEGPGVHVAIGSIDYGARDKGLLIYVKASLTGDESDYVRDYRSRNATFPHETTSDQFFSEEQFEVYRALGFHATHRAFAGSAGVAGLDTALKDMPSAAVPSKGAAYTGSGARRIVLGNLFK
jgi:Patatin-like phospholipase